MPSTSYDLDTLPDATNVATGAAARCALARWQSRPAAPVPADPRALGTHIALPTGTPVWAVRHLSSSSVETYRAFVLEYNALLGSYMVTVPGHRHYGSKPLRVAAEHVCRRYDHEATLAPELLAKMRGTSS
jgi:hypothetical protein